MKKIPQEVEAIVRNNHFLSFGMANGLLNLSSTARLIHPQVEARTKKEVTVSSITMALSRLQQTIKDTIPKQDYHVKRITVSSGIIEITYPLSDELLKVLHKAIEKVHADDGYITLSESSNEISILAQGEYKKLIQNTVRKKPTAVFDGLAAVGLEFDNAYAEIPGFFHFIMQQIMLQGINIVEITSTYSHLTIYVKEKDIKLLFDTLHATFLVSEN